MHSTKRNSHSSHDIKNKKSINNPKDNYIVIFYCSINSIKITVQELKYSKLLKLPGKQIIFLIYTLHQASFTLEKQRQFDKKCYKLCTLQNDTMKTVVLILNIDLYYRYTWWHWRSTPDGIGGQKQMYYPSTKKRRGDLEFSWVCHSFPNVSLQVGSICIIPCKQCTLFIT